MNSVPPGRALIIDDDALVGRMLAAHIAAAGFEAKVTANIDEFIELVRSWNPTHVFVDLVLSQTDGLEVLSRLAQERCEAAVIIQSGMGGRVLDAARQYAEANGLAYAGALNKPFTRAAVKEMLEASPRRVKAPSEAHAMLAHWTDEQLEAELRTAAEGGHLTVAFQPKVSCVDGAVAGFEALARWNHPSIGPIPPVAFVPRAESAGLIDIVTGSITRSALAWFATARANTGERLSINVSAVELARRNLDARLLAACREAGVSPERVILEVTETAAIGDHTLSLEILTRLRLDGFHLSIDDFGTGYSSMAQLADMPFTEVKVDQSFVRNLGESLPAEVMVRSMLQLARGLGLECTAEGVESPVALKVLQDLGCDYAQGYHIGRPMEVSQLEEWLAAR